MRKLDAIELEYERAINRARDQEEAIELAQGLKEYREMFKIPGEECGTSPCCDR